MKKFNTLLSLILCLFLVTSCGKDENQNVVTNPYQYGPGGGPGVPGNPGGNVPGYNNLAYYLGLLNSNQYYNYPYANSADYEYVEIDYNHSGSSWWIFNFNFSTSRTRTFYHFESVNGSFDHSYCESTIRCYDKSDLANYFAQIINDAVEFYPQTQTRFQIITSAQEVFEFDFSLGLVANPISYRDLIDGDSYYLNRITPLY